VPAAPSTVAAQADLDVALTGGLRTLFQPVVELATGDVVGWEALSRGPAGGLVEGADALFSTARAARRLPELDWACRCQALRAARLADLRSPQRLFVNAEPQAFGSVCPAHLQADWQSPLLGDLDVVVELTERYLLDAPAELLRAAQRLRERGWEIALDDVGVNDAGVALLPVVRPDVVKLDGRLMVEQHSRSQRHALAAVQAYVAGSGAHVVAEAIETEQDRDRALAMGADWGQGWLLGRPQPLPAPGAPGAPGVRPDRRGRPLGGDPAADPYDLLDPASEHRLEPEDVRAALDRECRAAVGRSQGALVLVVLGTPDVAPRGLPALLDRLHDLCALVVVLTGHVDLRRPPVVRTTLLDDADALRGDAAVVLLGPQAAVAVHAREQADGTWAGRRSTDVSAVAELARALLDRAEPLRRRGSGA